MSDDDDYAALLNLFIQLVQSQAETEIRPNEEWMADAQSLSVKMFYHLTAMQRLTSEIAVITREGKTTFVDHASVKVVTRAAFETYLVLFYIYSGGDPGLCEFRHTLWHLGGLCERQRLHVASDKYRKQLEEEKVEVEKLKNKILASPHSKNYDVKQLKLLLRGKWRGNNSWGDLAKIADFPESYFNNVYGFLCGYSHSSYISALQVSQARNSINDQKMLAGSIAQIGKVLMAHFAFAYPNIFDGAKPTLEAEVASKKLAQIWRFGRADIG